jgi:hypothetical protein
MSTENKILQNVIRDAREALEHILGDGYVYEGGREIVANLKAFEVGQRDLVGQPSSHEKALEALANSKESAVRCAIASTDGVPAHILSKLAKDNDLMVCEAVAHNESTPAEVLMRIGQVEYDEDVLIGVAWNPNTPVDTLTFLAENEDWRVREEVAGNSNTLPETLFTLAKDEDDSVRRAASRKLQQKVSSRRCANQEDEGVKL